MREAKPDKQFKDAPSGDAPPDDEQGDPSFAILIVLMRIYDVLMMDGLASNDVARKSRFKDLAERHQQGGFIQDNVSWALPDDPRD